MFSEKARVYASILVCLSVLNCVFLYKNAIHWRYHKNENSKSSTEPELMFTRNEIHKYLEPPSSKPYNESYLINSAEIYQGFYSTQFIRIYLKRLMPPDHRGFFVEAGALDGVALSNTLTLERNHSWTGLLIEPNPSNYRALRSNNRKAWISNSCISTVPYSKEATFIELKRADNLPNAEILKGSGHEEGTRVLIPSMKEYVKTLTKIRYKVQCFPLESYMNALNRTVIDFLSLDVQGSEWNILKTIPYDRITIRMMAVEMFPRYRQEIHTDFVEYMKTKGFRFVACGGEPDYIFVLNGDPVIMDYPGKEPTTCSERLYETVTRVARVPVVVTRVMDSPE